MRVLICSPVYARGHAEGMTRNIRYILDSLRRQRIEAFLLTPTQADQQLGRPFSSLLRGIELNRLLRNQIPKADILHINLQNPSQGLVLRGIPMPKSRVVCSIWGSYIEFGDLVPTLKNPELSHALLPELFPHIVLNTRLTASAGLAGLESLLVSCKFIEERIKRLRLPSSRVRVIPNGVDTHEYRPPRDSERAEVRESLGIAREQKVVVYYGHATRMRGVDCLVKSMALVFRKIPEALLLIAESGRRTFNLQKLIRDTGIAERTILLGHVNVPRILFAADLGVLPLASHVGAGIIPNMLLEMMAAGLPVVATTVGAIPDVVTHEKTGLLVEPCSPTQLAEAIIKLFTFDAMREDLGRAAHSHVEKEYDWRISIKKLIQLYRDLQPEAPPLYSHYY